jgi:hypothetical protein
VPEPDACGFSAPRLCDFQDAEFSCACTRTAVSRKGFTERLLLALTVSTEPLKIEGVRSMGHVGIAFVVPSSLGEIPRGLGELLREATYQRCVHASIREHESQIIRIRTSCLH